VRLLRGQRNLNQTLLPPMGLLVGALIFLVGGVGLLVIGLVERDVKPLLGGIGILPASYYAFRLAKERSRAAVTPNNALRSSPSSSEWDISIESACVVALGFEWQTRNGIAGEEQTASLYAALLDGVMASSGPR